MISGGVVPGRQLAQLGLRDGGDLRDGVGDVDLRLEVDFDDGDAVQRLRFDVLDIVDGRGQRALAQVDDAVGHLFRRRGRCNCQTMATTGILIFGKDIGRHVEDGERTENHQQERKDSKGVGPS